MPALSFPYCNRPPSVGKKENPSCLTLPSPSRRIGCCLCRQNSVSPPPPSLPLCSRVQRKRELPPAATKPVLASSGDCASQGSWSRSCSLITLCQGCLGNCSQQASCHLLPSAVCGMFCCAEAKRRLGKAPQQEGEAGV